MPRKPDERALRYVNLCVYRKQRHEEKQIAKKLGCGSPEELYEQLNKDGFPICTVCGETPARPDHCKRKRKARQSTEEVQLPRPQSAWALFLVALAWLEEDIESLRLYEEHLQGERFVTMLDEPEEELLFHRRMFYESDWEQICEVYGLDPAFGSFHVDGTGKKQPSGATQTPSRPLTRLIIAYVLVYEDLKPLLSALHPDPISVDKKKLSEKVEQLELVAGQLATIVRGGTLRRGPSTEEISTGEQLIAWEISRQREEGVSDEQILREIAYMGYLPYGRRLTKEDVSQLGGLRLKPPNH